MDNVQEYILLLYFRNKIVILPLVSVEIILPLLISFSASASFKRSTTGKSLHPSRVRVSGLEQYSFSEKVLHGSLLHSFKVSLFSGFVQFV